MSAVREPGSGERRGGPLFILTGLVIGAVFGLVYAWFINPVQYQNASPSSLRAADMDQYRGLIALAYSASGDLGRAQARLHLLGDPDPAKALDAQAQHYLAGNGPVEEARAMAQLAASLREIPLEAPSSTPAPTSKVLPSATTPAAAAASQAVVLAATANTTVPASSPTALATAADTATAVPALPSLPTLTPSPTPGAPFTLAGMSPVCDLTQTPGLLQVIIQDASGKPVPGVPLTVTWKDNGKNTFFTGLAPEINPGYADFVMTPGESYDLVAGENSSSPVNGLTPQQCTRTDGSSYWGGIKVRFKQ